MSDINKTERLAAIRAANATRSAPAAPAADTSETPQAASLAAADAPPPGAVSGALLDLDHLPPATPMPTVAALLLGAVVGALAAAFLLPFLLPGLTTSLLGEEPKAYWYLARSSAIVAYALTWLSMVFGLLITSKAARLWPGGPAAFDLHQHTSLLGLAFGLFHALILLGDRYIAATPLQVLTPFAYAGYRPFWVGLGQIALYMMAVVGLSFYIKPWLGRRAWRVIHVLSFALFALALAHGIFSGTDTSAGWAASLYWATGGGVLFLALYRFALSLAPAGKPRPAAR